MKKRFIKLIVLLALTALVIPAAAACTGRGETERVYDCLVTFDYNVDGTEANCPDQYVGLSSGSLIRVSPGYGTLLPLQKVNGMHLEGWYLPKLDGEGSPIADEQGKVELGRKWDFAADTVTEDITLYANLVPNAVLTVVVEGGTNVTFSYEPGFELERPSYNEPKKEGCTFYDYYSDAACTQKFDWDDEHKYTFGEEDETIYAKFLDGSWAIVSTAAELDSALGGFSNVWLDCDVDFTGYTRYGDSGWSFDAELNGNGHKIKGITRNFTYARGRSGFGIFGTLGENAYIHDLIIENAQVSFTVPAGMNVEGRASAALFAYSAAAGTRVEDVTVTGTLTLSVGNVAHEAHADFAIDGGAVTSGFDVSGVTVTES